MDRSDVGSKLHERKVLHRRPFLLTFPNGEMRAFNTSWTSYFLVEQMIPMSVRCGARFEMISPKCPTSGSSFALWEPLPLDARNGALDTYFYWVCKGYERLDVILSAYSCGSRAHTWKGCSASFPPVEATWKGRQGTTDYTLNNHRLKFKLTRVPIPNLSLSCNIYLI